jgi:rSAM/selenodomain-associated transferase 2
MPASVSVIIPALDEEERIAATIDAAFAAGAAEVIVADGGSRDATVRLAREHGAQILSGQSMRSRQLNAGAELASHGTLLFLHADTLLPSGAAEAVTRAIDDGAIFGGFRIAFIERTLGLRWTAFAINVRTRFSRAPWGDQAHFLRREDFVRLGRYREIPLMEDYDLAVRMKRCGKIAILPLPVRTSGRRFLEKGLVRTTCINWLVVLAFRFGISPDRLARWYRG